jgi:hypothetical protein
MRIYNRQQLGGARVWGIVMRCIIVGGLAWVMLAACSAPSPGQESKDVLAQQLKAAKDNWALVEAGDAAISESTHLILFGPKSLERRLKEIGGNLEKSYSLALKQLQLEPKEELWSGKLTVYLLANREQFTSFIRRIEKRRLEDDEVGSHSIEGDTPHAVAGPPRTKQDLSLEMQAAAQVANALLRKKAGAKTPLPVWLIAGFGRATAWRTWPTDKTVAAERKLAQALVAGKNRSATDVWENMLESEEAGVLRASMAEFIAYGPGAGKLVALLHGFKPEENQENRTTEQALESAGLDARTVAERWRVWVMRGGK